MGLIQENGRVKHFHHLFPMILIKDRKDKCEMPRSRIHHRQNDKLKKMPMTRIQIITTIFPFNCYWVLAMQKLQVLNNEKIILNDELNLKNIS